MVAVGTRKRLALAGTAVTAVVVVAVLVASSGSSALLAPATSPTAGPQPRWGPERTVRSVGHFALAVHADAQGRPWVLTNAERGWNLTREDGDRGRFEVRERDAGGPDGFATGGDFGLDARARPLVVWTTEHGLYADVDGHRSRITDYAVHLPLATAHGAGPPPLAEAPDGSALVAWTGGRGDDTTSVWVAQRRPGRSRFGAPTRLGGDASGAPVVLTDDRGGAVVVWHEQSARRIAIAVRRADGRFGAPVTTPRGDGIDYFDAAIGPSGRLVVVWSRFGGVDAMQRPGEHATFQPPISLMRTRGYSQAPAVAIDAHGVATTVWPIELATNDDPAQSAIAVSRWPTGGTPSTARRVTRTSGSGQVDPEVVTTPGGATVLFTFEAHEGDTGPWLAVAPDGRTARLNRPHGEFDPIFAGGAGGVVAVWDRSPSPSTAGDDTVVLSHLH